MKKLIPAILALVIFAGAFYFYKTRSQDQTSPYNPGTTAAVPSNSPPVSTSPTPDSAAASSEKLQSLLRTTLNNSVPHDNRRQALYALTQQGAAALPALQEIVLDPIPAASETFDIILRVTAMEALDDLSIDPKLAGNVKETMLKVLEVQKHRTLLLLAQISISGIDSGQPGKIKRATNLLMKDTEKKRK